MRKIILVMFVVVFSPYTQAARDVYTSSIDYIYQLDSDTTVFEFNSSVANSCGNNSYRVKSPTEAVASRKFALVLAAFTTGQNLAFHDQEICESGRSVVSWIRLTK